MTLNEVPVWSCKRSVMRQGCCLFLLSVLVACGPTSPGSFCCPSLTGTVTRAVTGARISGATVSAAGKTAQTNSAGL